MKKKNDSASTQGKYAVKANLILGICTIAAAVIAAVVPILASGQKNADTGVTTQPSAGQTSTSSTPEPTDSTWIDFMMPYESKQYLVEDAVKIMGNEYKRGVALDFSGTGGFALFNLDKGYKELSFEIGHIDGSAMYNASIKVFLDDELVQTIEGKADMKITAIAIDVTGASQMKLQWNGISGDSGSPAYGLINIQLR